MFQKFSFYIRHSLNDLKTNGQRTVFALLCIAAGVAAIVSLQNLGFMATDTLTGNLQQQNRGDIRVTGASFTGDNLLSRVDNLRDTLQLSFPGQTDVTYRMELESLDDIFLGGDATVIASSDTGRQAFQLAPIIIDPQVYPFYDTINGQDGRTLAEMMPEPTDIVLSEDAARDLNAEIGHTVRVRGSEQDFTVGGIVKTSEEISGFDDLFLGIFGYYYLHVDAVAYFPDLELQLGRVFVRVEDPTLIDDVERLSRSTMGFAATTTLEDLREENELIAEYLSTTVTMMGLLALLLGCVGIINTMQVVVRRRTLEIAVLKTIGLKANQVTMLFLVEALMMGIAGSILGVIIGTGLTYVIRSVGSTLVGGQEIVFRIAATPIINGVIVGTLVTTVFGFLPTLSAGQVRPGLVLRPTDKVMVRAGWWRTLLVMLGSVLVLGIIAQGILGTHILIALGGVAAAFILGAILYALLWIMIWLIGRLTPSLGLPEIKFSRRQLLSAKGRGAITLMALVVGIFALSTITLFAQSFTNLLDAIIESAGNETVLVQAFTENQLEGLEEQIQSVESVRSYTVNRVFNTALEGITRANGREIPLEEIPTNFFDQMFAARGFNPDELRDQDFISGGQVTGPGQMVIRDSQAVDDMDLRVGDTITLNFQGRGNSQAVSFEIVGITRAPSSTPVSDFLSDNRFLLESLPGGQRAEGYGYTVDMPEEDVWLLSQAISESGGTAFVFDLRIVSQVIDALIDEFDAFPTLVAVLGLIVGGVVIANSVALATLERRREIAVMKAVGLRRERVLGMLLVENGLLGIVGGLIGVGIGLLVLVSVSAYYDLPLDTIPYGTGMLLMSLCVIVALGAAITSAWGASGEKPLNVLRYE